jgi:galactose mutarotase-like enzyme
MSDQLSQWISLGSGDLAVQVNPFGAELSVLRDRSGRDLLWDGDPAVWRGRAPLLFPIIGELTGGKYRLDGVAYRLSRHGFARTSRFDVVESTATTVTLRLAADAATLAVYPFHFELAVRFEVRGSALTITAGIRNLGEVELPASFGYHPAFRWPLPYGHARADHFIEFSTDEPDPVRRLDAHGLLTAERHPTPIVHQRLTLADALFQHDAVIFDAVKSRSVSYGAATGPRLRVSYPDSAYLGVWSKPGASFVCIEPWRGIADPIGFAGDFRTKPGVFTVSPAATTAITMMISIEET